ncbi:MAG: putative sulfate exporter family transporter [Acidobacteriota bacterium]|nr:putative sulfate exporter family transporter [Acidobacteriota bacterium]
MQFVGAILSGILVSICFNLREDFVTKKIGSRLLQLGIVLLGFTISIDYAVRTSLDYFPWVSLFVVCVFVVGMLFSKALKLNQRSALLVVSGTAICGGTAMVAIAPIIKAKPQELVNALTLIFVLNTISIILFPFVGMYLDLSQIEFGAWSAFAIHDTSSVVGAAYIFGDEAVQVATTLKLGRTLWLIPLVLCMSWVYRGRRGDVKFPVFIPLFFVAIVANSVFDLDNTLVEHVKSAAKVFFLLGLFSIGTEIDRSSLQQVSLRTAILALSLWTIIIPSSLALIRFYARF